MVIIEVLDKYRKCAVVIIYVGLAFPLEVLLLQHLYDDHGTISPMDIEESDQKMKQ